MLDVDQLSCRRGARLLFSDLAFSIAAGELLCVGGANGSGKTSLLRIVAGLALPECGTVRWCGDDIHATAGGGDAYRSALLYHGHARALKDELGALDNLRLSCALAGDPSDEEAACDALDRLGLKGRWHLPARSLSQGQRQRAVLARLWLTRRRLWLLDEPLASLDAASSDALQARLASHLQAGGSVLVTTHQPLRMPTPARTLDLDSLPRRRR